LPKEINFFLYYRTVKPTPTLWSDLYESHRFLRSSSATTLLTRRLQPDRLFP
jgi:hypothetical protein